MITNIFVGKRKVCVRGFTMIELLIVVSIIGILAAISYPSYVAEVERGRRNDAKAVLLEAAQYMERRFTETRNYALITAADLASAGVNKSPKDSGAWYNISIVASDVSTYQLQARPRAGWTPKLCGTLTLNQLGVKTSAGSIEECWNK
ncbi:MAG: type IV pilin protein [Casimicrobium sp.]